jgi:cytochrome c oxidase cbb3-type subunit III
MVDSAAMANRLQTVPESLAPVIVLGLFVAVLLRPAQAAVQTPTATPEQLQAGQRVFVAQCGFCHGRDAMGGETGPNLTRSALLRDDAGGDALRAILREGRVDKGMPVFRLSDADTTAIGAFIRDQRTKSESPGARRTVDPDDLRSGNAERGRAYFNGAGRCATCHSSTGDLAGVATRRQGLELLQRMLYPSKSGAATVTVTPRTGDPVTGALAYRDEFTIAMTDASGAYRSWRAGDVTFTINNPLDAHVEQLAKYRDDDMHDVLAYLQTLR